MGRRGARAAPPPRRRRLSKRARRTASLPEILEALGQEDAAQGVSRKEALGAMLWQWALEGRIAVIKLVFAYLAARPPQRVSSEVTVQPMLPFTADEAAEATRQLAAQTGEAGPSASLPPEEGDRGPHAEGPAGQGKNTGGRVPAGREEHEESDGH